MNPWIFSRRAFVTAISLLAVFSSLAAHATPTTGLVISEIMFDPAGGDNGKQWLEI